MKKFLTLAVMILLVASYSLDITKNKVEAGADFGMGSYSPLYALVMPTGWTYDADDQFMNFTIPGVMYKFEAKPNDMFKLYLHGQVAYMMSKYTYDGDAPAGADNFASGIALELNPMGKFYLPNDLFVKVGLPFGYLNFTPRNDDADAIPFMGLDMFANFGFDNREIDMHGLTPWDLFEKGMAFYGVFSMGMMESIDGESTDDLPMYFGVEGCYAHQMEGNMMIKPYLSFMMQLNEDAAAKDTEVRIGGMFAKDFNEKFNLEADLNLDILDTEFSTWDSVAGEALDMLMKLNISAKGNFYVMPELNIFANLGMSMDLSMEETDMGMAYGLGAIYTMNLIK
jgi:hypothetical protein